MPKLETPELVRDSRAPYREVGRSVPRLEGAAKVTGSAEYIHNLRAARHAARQDLPQFHRARAHRRDRFERRARPRGRARRHHDRRGPDAGAEPVLRTGLPRPADPRARKGPARRRTGRRGAGRRPARRRRGIRPRRDRRTSRSRRYSTRSPPPSPARPSFTTCSSRPGCSPTSSTSAAVRAPTSRSTRASAAATWSGASPSPTAFSSTPSEAAR